MKRTAMLFLALVVAFSVSAQRRRAVDRFGPPCAQAEIAPGFYTNDVALDGDNLYFTDDTGGLFRVSKRGGAPATEIARTVDGSVIIALVVDPETIYFSTSTDDGTQGSIYSVPKSGGALTQLAAGVITPLELLSDDQFLYWNSLGTPSGEDIVADGKIETMKKDGSGRTALATDLNYPTTLALDGANVLFGEAGIATGNSNAGLRSVPKSGGTVTTILDRIPTLAVTTDATNIYAGIVEVNIAGIAGTIVTIAKSTNKVTAKLATEADTLPLYVQIVGNELYYYLFADTDSIRAVPLVGGTSRVVRTGIFTTPIFEVDGCSIFYGSVDENTFEGVIGRGPR